MAPQLSTMPDVLAGDGSSPALFLGSGGAEFTRGELNRLIVQFAETLRRSGVKPGDVITIAEANTVEFIVAFLGAIYARAVAAPLNQAYRPDEFKFYMEDAGTRLLVVGPGGNAHAEEVAFSPVISVAVKSSDGGFALDVQHKAGELSLSLAPSGADAVSDPPLPDDVGLFLHTSGTTSRPKGVPLTQGNLVASLANISDTYEFTPSDRSLLVMPLFHVHGLMAGLLSPLAAGASVILPAKGGFAASTFWQDAVQYGATFYTAVPTMHQILLARAESDYPKDAPPSLRFIRSCSSSLAPATLEKLEAAFKAPVLEAYAMTEASHQMTSNPLPKHGSHKPGTVGKAQGTVQVTILDDKCQQLGPGQVGEVCIRGPNVTKGYLNNPAANEEAFAGGWFHTGDQGFLDEEGYLTLTGRIKELINRGGEKISPIEVDGVLLSHPQVAEAVSFAAPDEKYGEIVAAAMVLTPEGKANPDIEASIRQHAAHRLAAFKVPAKMFFADTLPKTATGKIQRRFMVEAFITKPQAAAAPKPQPDLTHLPHDGYFMVARALATLGVRHMYGVIGIPVTQLASAAQACGIRFISFRNEQAAGYAAAAAGFLTGVPGVLLTVSGPGVVHGLAGLSGAQVNGWPIIMISGSCEQNEVGKGAFQELDQLAAVSQYVKYKGQAASTADIPRVVAEAFQAAVSGIPGATYVDIPSNILMSSVEDAAAAEAALAAVPRTPGAPKPAAPVADVAAAAALLRGAKKPLVVLGTGAAFSQSETELRRFIEATGLPFLATAMGRGVVPDDSPLCVNAARSMALAGADVALIFGTKLNWQLHFGESPKWGSAPKFVLIDTEPEAGDVAKCAAVVQGDPGVVAGQLLDALQGAKPDAGAWVGALTSKVAAAREKMSAKLQKVAFPLDYHSTLSVIREAITATTPAPVVVAEGANTMDNARVLLEPVTEPRTRLDAGIWGTMGVGPGYAIAAATVDPGRLVVAVEGDSAFGFSGMEVETMARYNLPITVVIFNNGGIYGGDRREAALREAAEAGLAAAGYPDDPPPTAFVPNARYELLMEAFGGRGVAVSTAQELRAALKESFASRRSTLLNVAINPMAGVESGNVHAFNAPKSTAG